MVTLGSWLSGALSETWGPRRVMWIGLGIWQCSKSCSCPWQ